MSNDVTEKLLKTYNLPIDAIEIIETDLFNYVPTQQFDLMLSSDFIEHFENIPLLIQKHVDCLVGGSKLLITLPNPTGYKWLGTT
ncbi:MAG: hypothetical protein H7331_04305 [Bacteroidia bacterium]|nr:hypothetical protein [Bacteroidia bacterium]